MINKINKGQTIREASLEDLDFLVHLENEAFEPYRASSKNMIKSSILSQKQMVLIVDDQGQVPCGSLILKINKESLRIYSIAVLDNYKYKGYGKKLMDFALNYARENLINKVYLEVDAEDEKLIQWYEMYSFKKGKLLLDYYHKGKHALKMTLKEGPVKSIIVTDYESDFFDDIKDVIQVRAYSYIDNDSNLYSKNFRVFNLCSNYHYQSIGYYVSLLALARNQVAFPSTSMIKDVQNKKVLQSIGEEIHDAIQNTFKREKVDKIMIKSYFARALNEKYQGLVGQLNNLYHGPLMTFTFIKKDQWTLNQMKLHSISDLSQEEKDRAKPWAIDYFSKQQFKKGSLKSYDYDMAVLIDPDEKTPPSDKKALGRFVKASEKKGFSVTFITKKDYNRLPEFDALFIRTTTNVNDYTYEFSRYAYAEGLVVIDDPWSILRCANKVYLYDALKKSKIPMPESWIFNKKNYNKSMINKLTFPMVLKLPDSAFSAGVYKVESLEAFQEKLKILFKKSDLIIGQKYMPSDYDWRIGILDGKFLFACKYYMVKNHWQILNWSQGDVSEGDYESISERDVPKYVLDIAFKAAKIIGDGLYGVDLKVIDDEVYVIEVNDNPNIEFDVEDYIDKNRLYETLVDVFYNRLENSMKTIRLIN
jgi:glutathione synthase/RimK-type ligase-like ATP-grasp enzyme/ribosomal protein S18 acetylase RimI-like enzyme